MKNKPIKTPFKLPSGRTIRLTDEEIKSLREQLSPTKEKVPLVEKADWARLREKADEWHRNQPRLEPHYIPVPYYVPVYPRPTTPFPFFH